jgi:hypothetical protein
MADTFKQLGAVAASLPILKPLNPDLEFKNISSQVIWMLARMMAKDAIRAQLRNEGIDVRFVLPRDINERATKYLAQHPEVWKEAITLTHRIDDKRGQRKARQKELRQLRQRRSHFAIRCVHAFRCCYVTHIAAAVTAATALS